MTYWPDHFTDRQSKMILARSSEATSANNSMCATVPRARARTRLQFTVIFYGLKDFCCKTAQFCATPCEPACLWSALKNTLRNMLKNCAKSLL
jgi:hypothetical protein